MTQINAEFSADQRHLREQQHFMKTTLFILSLLLTTTIFAQQKHYLLVGTYTGTGSKGIYVYSFDPGDASVRKMDSIEVSNPSFLTIAPAGNFVYAVSEDRDSTNPSTGGGVNAFSFNKRTGRLKFINRVSSEGSHPCYISMDKSGKWVLVANYSSGSFSVFPIGAKGQLLNARQTTSHSGNSVNTERQNSPHAHAALLSSDNKMLYVTDLGTDKIMCYPFNTKNGNADVRRVTAVHTDPGSGPRHLAFHPNKKYAYVVQELTATVTLYTVKNNKLTEKQNISSNPLTYKGPAGSADIHVSPDGKFLYVSNRALSNTIAIFRINQKNGMLTIIGHQYTMGIKPRNFNFDPTGKYLLVANQDTDQIVIFKRDPGTGMLTDTGKRIAVPRPVCLQWISRKADPVFVN